jgi:hypothetical protein
MNTQETDRLRAIRQELCEMEQGEEKLIENRRVRRLSQNLTEFELVGLNVPPQDLAEAEALLSDPTLAAPYVRQEEQHGL